MTRERVTLLCWHAERAGIDVLVHAIRGLHNRRFEVGRVLYLVQDKKAREVPTRVEGVDVETIGVSLDDPTEHSEIYKQVGEHVLPRLRHLDGTLHINVSPGTPAMHSVWLILHAGGALPEGTQLWSSQFNKETKRTRIDPVDFPVTTYLSEIRRLARAEPELAVYDPEARSLARRTALTNLSRYARVLAAPLLILGERGTGKTRKHLFVRTIGRRSHHQPRPAERMAGSRSEAVADNLLTGLSPAVPKAGHRDLPLRPMVVNPFVSSVWGQRR